MTWLKWRSGRAKAKWARQMLTAPSFGHIFTVRDFSRGLALGALYSDKRVTEILAYHSPHSNHCGGYDVLAWPCSAAQSALETYICLHDGENRPCPIHDWTGADL